MCPSVIFRKCWVLRFYWKVILFGGEYNLYNWCVVIFLLKCNRYEHGDSIGYYDTDFWFFCNSDGICYPCLSEDYYLKKRKCHKIYQSQEYKFGESTVQCSCFQDGIIWSVNQSSHSTQNKLKQRGIFAWQITLKMVDLNTICERKADLLSIPWVPAIWIELTGAPSL